MQAIETGAECERWVPQLSLLADGEASARDLADLRPHLRSCPACRATLRGFSEAPRQVGALVPAALAPLTLAGVGGGGLGLGRHLEALAHTLSERAAAGAMRMQGALEALPGTKVAAVAASTAAIAGGGAAIDRVATGDGERRAKAEARAVAADRPAAGAAQPLLATSPAAAPIARLGPPGPAVADPAVPRAAASRPSPVPEFGFEAASADRAAGGRRPRPRARAASAARRTAPDFAPRATPPPPRRPAEFQPAPPPAAGAAAGSPPAPSPPPSPQAPRPQAPPEFGGP